MPVATLESEIDFDGWRSAARAFRLAGVLPGEAAFRVAGSAGQGGLFDAGASGLSSAPPSNTPFAVPRAFVDMARSVILHRDPDRFDRLYRLLWRLQAEPDLMRIVSDPDVADVLTRARAVSRAGHKMKAFVRFRRVETEGAEDWIAWFEPAHRVLERTAPFFVERFATMRWSILTPDGAAFWDGEALRFGPPATRDQAPRHDEIEDFWKTYYASTFNPARLKVGMMRSEMPKRYWANLPEAALIPELIGAASTRARAMAESDATPANPRMVRAHAPVARAPTAEAAPLPRTAEAVREQVEGCRRCALWRDATHGVCGEGPESARLMIVGEQPGDQEDLAGRPFVGPAGRVLDAALIEAGIDRSDVFVTNAVRHFKHEPRGKRRLHKTPNAGEVQACRWWLDAERARIRPHVIVALGATAGLAVLSRKVVVTRERGVPLWADDGTPILITVHPAYLLRLPDADVRIRERAAFVADLRAAKALISTESARPIEP